MGQVLHTTIHSAIQEAARCLFFDGKEVDNTWWQGKLTKAEPHKQMIEILFHSLRAPIPWMSELAEQTGANMPWAEDHFMERIGGQPLNPGEQYKNWPYYVDNKSNDQSRVVDGDKFHHTYMERFWPKRAGLPGPTYCHCDGDNQGHELGTHVPNHRGIRFEYGDLNDVVDKLRVNPTTRQAFLPVWFPEDTGKPDDIRVPCTLGYLFMIRDGKIHVTYYIRSCDIIRHFKDDIYLACRLAHMIAMCIPYLEPGYLHMHIGSLHCFSSEKPMLKYFWQ